MSKKTSIGGQALIEGIMMKGPYKTTMAVRKKDGTVDLSPVPEKHLKDKYKFFGLPFVRGMVNLIEAMVFGYKALMKSADISGFTDLEDDEPQSDTKKTAETETETEAKTGTETEAAAEVEHKAESEAKVAAESETEHGTEVGAGAEAEVEHKAAEELALNTKTAAERECGDEPVADNGESQKGNDAFTGIIMVIGTVLGVVLACALFMYLPSLIFKGIEWVFRADLKVFKGVIEGIVKIIIFITYIALVSLEKDIKRVFMYHGAEHKTIFCYENGQDLTVENVRKFKRFHPRCGTSFMFLMIVVGIVIGTVLVLVLPDFIVERNWLWVPLKILLIPITCGLGYEIIRICGKHDNWVTRIIAAPGLWVQRLTTKEPDDGMIEIAIAALSDVIPEDGADVLP